MNKNIILILVTSFFSNLFLVSSIQNIYFQKLGFSLYSIGILLSVLQITKTVFEVPTGFISDKYGNKISVIISQLLILISLLIFYTSSSFLCFIFSMIILGLAMTFSSGSIDSLLINNVIYYYGKNKLSKYNSINRLLFYLSIGISSILAGVIAEKSFLAVYKLTIYFQIVPLILLFFIIENRQIETSPREKNIFAIKTFLIYLKNNKIIKYFIILDLIISFYMIPIDNFYSLLLYDSLKINMKIIGIIIFMQFIICSIIGLGSDFLTSKISAKNILHFFPPLMIICFLSFTLVSNIYLKILSYFLGLSIFCLFSPQKHKIMHSNLDDCYRTKTLSIESLLMSLLSTFVHPFVGYLSDCFSLQYSFIFILCITLIVLSIFIFAFHTKSELYT